MPTIDSYSGATSISSAANENIGKNIIHNEAHKSPGASLTSGEKLAANAISCTSKLKERGYAFGHIEAGILAKMTAVKLSPKDEGYIAISIWIDTYYSKNDVYYRNAVKPIFDDKTNSVFAARIRSIIDDEHSTLQSISHDINPFKNDARDSEVSINAHKSHSEASINTHSEAPIKAHHSEVPIKAHHYHSEILTNAHNGINVAMPNDTNQVLNKMKQLLLVRKPAKGAVNSQVALNVLPSNLKHNQNMFLAFEEKYPDLIAINDTIDLSILRNDLIAFGFKAGLIAESIFELSNEHELAINYNTTIQRMKLKYVFDEWSPLFVFVYNVINL